MAKLIDMSGLRFGRLTVLQKHSNDKHRKTIWLCQCDCGNTTTVSRGSLIYEKKRSCGCLKLEQSRIHLRPHALRALKGHVERVTVEGTRLDMIKTNKEPSQRNSSGVVGVHWEEQTKKWRACIGFKGQRIRLGRFSDFDDAVQARKEAEEKYFAPVLHRHMKRK